MSEHHIAFESRIPTALQGTEMPSNYIALMVVGALLISGALWLLREVKKYRARIEAKKVVKVSAHRSTQSQRRSSQIKN